MTDCCLWCSRSYEARKDGGKRQRFCSPAHRRAFHHAPGLWMVSAIETGVMSRSLLREGLASNAALVPGSLGAAAPAPARPPGESSGQLRALRRRASASVRREGHFGGQVLNDRTTS